MTEDEMVGWHHPLNGHEFEQALGDGERQGSLECCSPWGCKAWDTIEQLNNSSVLSWGWIGRAVNLVSQVGGEGQQRNQHFNCIHCHRVQNLTEAPERYLP